MSNVLIGSTRKRPRSPIDPDADRGIFVHAPFVPMRTISIQDDYVVGAVDGRIGEYAIGHLPKNAQTLFSAPSSIDVSLANVVKRTMLGIPSKNAIEDIHDTDPGICPVAIAMMRMRAVNAGASVREFLRAAAVIGELRGEEIDRENETITYQVSERRLTIECSGPSWRLTRDRLDIHANIPVTACHAAIGRPIGILIDHPAFRDVDATIKAIRVQDWGVEVHYQAEPLRARRLPEARHRRMD